MITVSIFTLPDVIQQVQVSYKILHNSTTHTSPAVDEDVAEICTYLESQTLQSYTPNHKENSQATPAQDLLSAGAVDTNTAAAFNNFQWDACNATNHGTAHSNMNTNADDKSQSTDANNANADFGGDVDLDVDDLAMDEEEFPVGTDIADLIDETPYHLHVYA